MTADQIRRVNVCLHRHRVGRVYVRWRNALNSVQTYGGTYDRVRWSYREWTHLRWRNTAPGPRSLRQSGTNRTAWECRAHRCNISDDAATPLEWSVWTAEEPADDIRDLGEHCMTSSWANPCEPSGTHALRLPPFGAGDACDISQSIIPPTSRPRRRSSLLEKLYPRL